MTEWCLWHIAPNSWTNVRNKYLVLDQNRLNLTCILPAAIVTWKSTVQQASLVWSSSIELPTHSVQTDPVLCDREMCWPVATLLNQRLIRIWTVRCPRWHDAGTPVWCHNTYCRSSDSWHIDRFRWSACTSSFPRAPRLGHLRKAE